MPFGNRYLTNPEELYQHNAWDDYAWTEKMEADAKMKINEVEEVLIPRDIQGALVMEADIQWDNFYDKHKFSFFKDRKWLEKEFPELFDNTCNNEPTKDVVNLRILEVGCGPGNTVLPLLKTLKERSAKFIIYACDFSRRAIHLLSSAPDYDAHHCQAFTEDISKPDLIWPFPNGSIDVVCMIFVLSALPPDRFRIAIKNVASSLRPGGVVLFRDYSQFDMAQLRFKKGQCLSKNFYARGDGTLVYFFTQDEVRRLFDTEGFCELENRVDKRLIVNRKKKLTMHRMWIVAKFRKIS